MTRNGLATLAYVGPFLLDKIFIGGSMVLENRSVDKLDVL